MCLNWTLEWALIDVRPEEASIIIMELIVQAPDMRTKRGREFSRRNDGYFNWWAAGHTDELEEMQLRRCTGHIQAGY